MADVDFNFISLREGGQLLKGYVPAATTSQSGVTIATGFDLGARSKTDLQKLGFSMSLIDKLSPYLGLKQTTAETVLRSQPLEITKTDADQIDKASKAQALNNVESAYDAAVAGTGRAVFKQLAREAQTVIASVSFQYGSLPSRTPKFWGIVVRQEWAKAVAELRAFGDAYVSRRMAEADLLEKVVKGGGTASSSGSKPATSVEKKPVQFTAPGSVSWSQLLVGDNKPKRSGITASVGERGQNDPEDVKLVRQLLNDHRPVPYAHLPIHGRVDGSLIVAIKEFQAKCGLKAPDGKVDPGGFTWGHLTAKNGSAPGGKKDPVAAPQPPTSTPPGTTLQIQGQYFFPFSTLTTWSWESAPRSYGCNRSKGKRAHGGCDLYYPVGTPIHAVGKGKVIEWNRDFYCQTGALVVQHEEFIIRYGEVQQTALVKKDDTVEPGQVIAKVGLLVGIEVPSAMLHFEMFAGTATGPFTDKTVQSAKRPDGVPFQRRKDLLNPTSYLNAWKTRLPTAG